MPVVESEIVLLESPAVLAQLLLGWTEAASRRDRRRHGSQSPAAPKQDLAPSRLSEEPQPKRRDRPHVCRCGACARCLDNARWNRVFEEKFADPSYYGGIFVRHNSPLAGA
jgi:hypothetical protein